MNSRTRSETTAPLAEAARPRIIGFVCAGVMFLFLAAIIIPCFVDSRSAVNEASAAGALRTLSTAQKNFSEQHPEKGFASSLSELGPSSVDGQIDAALASGTKSGYIFTVSPGARDSTGHITKYAVTASPQTFSKTGMRSFFVDQSGVIRYTVEDRRATASDPPLS